jgi:imidazolonepropionase-like amidohydrolase
VRRALEASVDGIEHVSFLDGSGRSDLRPELADRLVATGTPLGGTIAANYRYLHLAQQGLAPPDRVEVQTFQCTCAEQNAGTLYRLGARFVAASDAGWRYTAFGDVATELERMVAAGMPAAFVIDSATSRAAEYLRLSRLGRIEPGSAADLLVVAGDPLNRISDLRSVLAVYRCGSRVVPAAAAV